MHNKPFKILDLFCKAGGASFGMFWVDPLNISITGVDLEPQSSYPFSFINADFREVDLSRYDFIWASPPCQAYSRIVKKKYRANHPDYITKLRSILKASGKPYCIENVPCSPLNTSLKLHGGMFSMPYRKERWFETSFFVMSPGSPRVVPETWFTGKPGEGYKPKAIKSGLEWMNYNEFNNAVPPEYSYFILKSYLDGMENESVRSLKDNFVTELTTKTGVNNGN